MFDYNSQRISSTSGKIILSGEYAVLFGEPGIAMPSTESMHVTWEAGKENVIQWTASRPWAAYAEKIAHAIRERTGTYTIKYTLPLGKGMGSSTALVVAMCRAALGPDSRKSALAIEDTLNKGHSGLDFAVIWEGKPIHFIKGKPPLVLELPKDLLENAELVDTGRPDQTTTELVAWIRTREAELKPALHIIGQCTERILAGEDLKEVIRDHHRAQVALGVVPQTTQHIIAEIERGGGAGKVLGAGARTGGGGMVLVLR